MKNFILDKIDSVGQLEVLLLLHKFPNRSWTAEQVSSELRSNVAAAQVLLESLVQIQIVKKTESNQFQFLIDSTLKPVVDRLAVAYGERRVSVINWIYNKPEERIKGFAKAFKLRKDE